MQQNFLSVQNHAHDNAIKNGYYHKFDELLQSTKDNKKVALLAILNGLQEEISEASKAIRTDKFIPSFNHNWYNKDYFESEVKNTFEAELGDAFIYLISLCKHLEIDILHIAEIINFHNENRGYKNGKEIWQRKT